jgi:hypothetical protein
MDVTTAVARKNPVVDNLLTAKEIGQGTYKMVNGRDTPPISNALMKGLRAVDRMETKPRRKHDPEKRP